MKSVFFCVLFFSLLVTNAEAAEENARVDAEAAFEILKEGLVGEWEGKIVHSSEPVEATFYLTGNESAIVECA